MSYWQIQERARNIGTNKDPHFVTVWWGEDEEGGEHWLVNSKPDPTTPSGPVYGVQGGPSTHGNYPDNLDDAIEQYREDIDID